MFIQDLSRKERKMDANEVKGVGQFYIRVRQGSLEIEVAAPNEAFVQDESSRLIEQILSKADSVYQPEESLTGSTLNSNNGQNHSQVLDFEALGEFFWQFKFRNNLDKILVLGYWYEKKLNQSSFGKDDIELKFKEVRDKPPTQIVRDIKSLVGKKGFLVEGNKDSYSLTKKGMTEVESKIPRSDENS